MIDGLDLAFADEISSDFDADGGFSISLNHADGDNFTATVTSDPGNVSSIHVYRVDKNAAEAATLPYAGTVVDPFRYWGVKVFGTSNPVYKVVYNYTGHPGINIDDEDDLVIVKRDGNGDDSWEVATNGFQRDPEANTLTLTGQTGTQYAFASENGDNTLPVELTSFNAYAGNAKITLQWTTESEINNLGFILERTIEDDNFQEIASYKNTHELKGQGNSSTKTEYIYTDRNLIFGIKYKYRIAEVTITGEITYLDTISATTEFIIADFKLFANYPNPFNPGTLIKFCVPNIDGADKQIKITIYDGLGRPVRTILKGKLAGGIHSIYWNGKNEYGENVGSGIYFINFRADKFATMRKIMLLK